MICSTRPMKVEVISITPPEEVVRVWTNSRPDILSIEDGEVKDLASGKYTPISEYLNQLIDMNLSNLYFANVTLLVTSSLLTREFFYHFDSYLAQWAKTNRNGIDETKMCFSSEAYDPKLDKPKIFEFHDRMRKFRLGELKNFDDVKATLPLSFQTTWQMSLPIKLLMRILGYMFHCFGHCQFTHEVWWAFDSVPQLRPYMKLIGKYCDYQDPMFPSIEAEEAHESGNRITISKKIGMTVFSHLIRHEGLHIGGFISAMRKYLNGTAPRTGDELTFQCSISTVKERWIEIIRLRTSWFAMTDNWDSPNSWGVFLKGYITGNLQADKPYLKYFKPNGEFDPSSVMSYANETSIRVRKGNKTQLPDAFVLQDKEILMERICRVGLNPLLNDYLQMFASGYVIDNPKNPERLRWEELESENVDRDNDVSK